MKNFLFRFPIAFAFLTVLLLLSCSKPIPTDYDSSQIDPSQEPLQEALSNETPIKIEIKGWSFIINPKASYKINGEVLSVKKYYSGIPALLSPCDIALVFGDLYVNGLYKEIKWSQSGRWYWWKYSASFPKKDDRYIARWSSNNHIIPASDNIRKAAKSVSRGDLVVLVGQLVYVEGKKQDANFWWRSSLSRNDTGGGSCEVLYLQKIRIGDNIYE